MSLRQIYAWIAILTIGLFPAQSVSDPNVADASIRCSGLYYILTSLTDNSSAASLGAVMGNIFKIHQSAATRKALSNSDLFRARDEAAVNLGKLYDETPADVVDFYLQCNRWRRELGKHFDDSGYAAAANSENEEMVNQIILAAPGLPESVMIPKNDRMEIEQAMAEAFKLWTDNKRVTRSSALDILRKEVESQTEEEPED